MADYDMADYDMADYDMADYGMAKYDMAVTIWPPYVAESDQIPPHRAHGSVHGHCLGATAAAPWPPRLGRL